MSCDICHEPTRNRTRDTDGDLLCKDCRAAVAFYRALTPEAFKAELAAIAAHTQAVAR